MNKVYRNGLDVGIAFSSAGRRIASRVGTPAAALDVAGAVAATDTAAPASAEQAVGGPTLRVRLKRLVRTPARLAFRLFRPLLRPLAFRTRRYLSLEVQQAAAARQQAMQEEMNRLAADLLREIQVSREILRQELSNVQQQALRDNRLQFDAMLQRLATDHADSVRDVVKAQQQELAGLHSAIMRRAVMIDDSMAQQFDAQRQAADDVRAASMAATGASHAVQALASNMAPRLDRIEQYGYAAARRVIVNCGAGDVLMKTEAGYLLCPGSERSIIACLADTGDLERGTRLLIQRVLGEGDVFVDVGANLGIHTLAAAVAMHGRGKIIAFEPFETTRLLLEQTVRINGYAAITEIHQAAVSDHSGRQALYLGKSSGHHSLYALADADANAAAAVDVITLRLDDVIARDLPVTMIKIDAEGAELDVLSSAAATIRNNPEVALIVEFGLSHLQRNGQTGRGWLDAFEAFGLEYRAIDADTGGLDMRTLEQLEAVESVNLLFARPAASCWIKAGRHA